MHRQDLFSRCAHPAADQGRLVGATQFTQVDIALLNLPARVTKRRAYRRAVQYVVMLGFQGFKLGRIKKDDRQGPCGLDAISDAVQA